MKVVVIGCTHAGTAAVKTLANLNKNIDITVYEKNNNVSFLSCGIAYMLVAWRKMRVNYSILHQKS